MCTKASDIQSYFYQHYVKQQNGNDQVKNSYGRNIHPEKDKTSLFYVSKTLIFIRFEDDLRPSTKKYALTLHANKDPIGQFQTYHSILQSKITILNSRIDQLRESPARVDKTIKRVSNFWGGGPLSLPETSIFRFIQSQATNGPSNRTFPPVTNLLPTLGPQRSKETPNYREF